MVALNTTRNREVPTGRTSYRRSFFGKFILTVEIERQLNTALVPSPPPPHLTKAEKQIWNEQNDRAYEERWQSLGTFFRDATDQDMENPLLKKEFTT